MRQSAGYNASSKIAALNYGLFKPIHSKYLEGAVRALKAGAYGEIKVAGPVLAQSLIAEARS